MIQWWPPWKIPKRTLETFQQCTPMSLTVFDNGKSWDWDRDTHKYYRGHYITNPNSKMTIYLHCLIHPKWVINDPCTTKKTGKVLKLANHFKIGSYYPKIVWSSHLWGIECNHANLSMEMVDLLGFAHFSWSKWSKFTWPMVLSFLLPPTSPFLQMYFSLFADLFFRLDTLPTYVFQVKKRGMVSKCGARKYIMLLDSY